MRAILAVALLLAGCAAPRFAELHSDFARLQELREQCNRAREPQQAAVCGADDGTAFVDLARNAAKAAAGAADERTRIALLRLAAVAGWESRLPAGLDLAEAAAAEGIARCDALSKERFGAPRDCALLRIAPGVVVHVRTFLLLDSLRARAPTDAERGELGRAGTAYVANAWDFVDRARREHIDNDPAVHESVRRWLDRQYERFYCTLVQLEALSGRSDLLVQADRYVKLRPSLGNLDCSRPLP